jgi:cytochrome c2
MALIALMIAGLFVLAACAQAEEPTSTSVTFNPTPGGQPTPTTPAQGTGTPQATATTAPADPAAGQALFNSNGCSGCHSTGSDTIFGPGLGGIATTAATRRPGMSADDYIRESIVDSQEFLVPGFPPAMPSSFPNLSQTDVNNLIAYLKTLP